MPVENPASVSIHNKDRMITGVEKNRVRSFRPDAVQIKQLLAELFCRLQKEFFERASYFSSRNATKVFNRIAFWRK